MKKPYAMSTLKQKFSQTGIPKEVRDKLHLYLVACSHFYRVLSIDDVWEVICTNERRQGVMEEDDFADPELLECVRFYALEELRRSVEDRVEDRMSFMEEGFRQAVEMEFRKELEEYETKELGKILNLLHIIITPLTAEGYKHRKGWYELTREDFDRFIAIKERAVDRYFVLPEDEFFEDGEPDELYLVDINLMLDLDDETGFDFGIDYAANIMERAYDKPLYVPEDIMCYINSSYFEQTTHVEKMEEYLCKKMFPGIPIEEVMADEDLYIDVHRLTRELHRIITSVSLSPTEDIQKAIEQLEENKIRLDDMDDTNEFLRLYTDMSNNTRLPSNKGHKPGELRRTGASPFPEKITFGPGIQQMIRDGEWDAAELKRDIMTQENWSMDLRADMMREVDRALEPGEERVINPYGTIVKGRKIKPNEPCPCGSGRKYKHCCGKRS